MKLSKWEQEARCKLIRRSKDHGGIRDWTWTRNGIFGRITAEYCDGDFETMEVWGCNGTTMEINGEPVGGWGNWLPDQLRTA